MNNTLAFFFSSFSDTEKQTAEQCVRSLIIQLSEQVLSRPDDVSKLFQENNDDTKQPTWDGLIRTLNTLLTGFKRFCIMLEALDEYNAREPLLQMLASLTNVDNVQTIVTSRDEAYIREALSLQISQESIIVLQPAVVNEDIRSYVSHRLQTTKDFSGDGTILRSKMRLRKRL
jgi:hypothetical protein